MTNQEPRWANAMPTTRQMLIDALACFGMTRPNPDGSYGWWTMQDKVKCTLTTKQLVNMLVGLLTSPDNLIGKYYESPDKVGDLLAKEPRKFTAVIDL